MPNNITHLIHCRSSFLIANNFYLRHAHNPLNWSKNIVIDRPFICPRFNILMGQR